LEVLALGVGLCKAVWRFSVEAARLVESSWMGMRRRRRRRRDKRR
jgi:hypothetical protein